MRPPDCIWRPAKVDVAEAESADAESGPTNDDDAVDVASMVPVWMRSTWKPEASDVEVAVEVAISSRSMRAVDDAISEYATLPRFVSDSAVDVPETDWPR